MVSLLSQDIYQLSQDIHQMSQYIYQMSAEIYKMSQDIHQMCETFVKSFLWRIFLGVLCLSAPVKHFFLLWDL